jgi:GT2 family glycosyltransferase
MMNDALAAPQAVGDAQPDLPPTSLIIPSRGRPDLLLDTVQSILKGEQVPSELVVVDQSSAPHPTLAGYETGRDCKVNYIWSQSKGVSRARNEGIAAAQHAILAFTDDDVLVTATWFELLVRALIAAGPKCIITGQVRPAETTTADGFVPSTKTDETPRTYTQHADEDVLYAGNMALYRSALVAVGTFDERLGAGTRFGNAEDNDLGYRLLDAQYAIHYVPEAIVYHRSWRSARDFVPLRWDYGVGRGAYYAKHLSWRNPHMTRRLLADVRNHVVNLPRFMLRDRMRARGDLMLAAGILSGAARWLITYGPTRKRT